MEEFLYQAVIYLSAAVVAVPISARLGMGSVLGYLLSGIVIGPILSLVGSETQELQHFAEFGVVVMLFLIGLELEPKALWNMRHRLLGLGGLQVVGTSLVIAGCGMALGLTWSLALAVGMTFALSSTAIVLQTLSEKGLMQSPGGRSIISVLLTQDIAVIPILAILPLLPVAFVPQLDDSGAIQVGGEEAHHAMSLVEGLPGWGVALVTVGAVAAVILAGIFLTRPLFKFIHMAKLRELYTATALLMVVMIAFLMNLVGLSPALGTFLGGVMLANSEFRHQIEADLNPFKGLLLGLFFITVGAGINFTVLWNNIFTIIGLTLGVMLVKGLILFALAWMFKLRTKGQWLFTLGLAQAGEFGFVLVGFMTGQRMLDPVLAQILLLVVAMTMLLTPLFFILYEKLSERMAEESEAPEPDEMDETAPVIIAGLGRFGQVVSRMVSAAGVNTTVLDHNLETINLLRRFGFKGFFGDPTRPELLHAAGIHHARVLVVALDNPKTAVQLVHYAREVRPDIHIIARARDRLHVYELYKAGANDIIRELFDSSLRAGRYVLENMEFSEFEASEVERRFYKHDRHILRELAELWNPDIPLSQNEAYVARTRELNSELEAALVREILQGRSQGGADAAE
ncbi:cation:proton antiporter [Vannielia litorea]|uniref:cation:proton antiporter domain-containing protein n=1 Tax=Vannielia litorea TaxID=1217970 RepID=UPI001C94BB74|nr:cation:proton antiporter [Vannielia litorea]MBY6153635.1 cation:proton antiporter [Vannielia litorea]